MFILNMESSMLVDVKVWSRKPLVTLIEAFILAVVQGLTEWLPVSSSGHLVIFQHFLGLNPPLIFDLMLHIGTLTVVLVVFRQDIIDILKALTRRDTRSDDGRLAIYIVVGSIPITIVGVTLRNTIEKLFSNLLAVGIALLVTAAILFVSEKRTGNKKIKTADSLIVGLAQAAALIPGISRSGTTISTGLLRKIDKQTAFKFSFLLSAPTIVGATVFELKDLTITNIDAACIFLGTIVSMVVGYISLKILQKIVMSQKFHLFANYCAVVGAAIIVYMAIQ
jgi:undecaprenyl-diphosphatase